MEFLMSTLRPPYDDNGGAGAGGASAAREEEQQQQQQQLEAGADAEPIPVARLVIDQGGNFTAAAAAATSSSSGGGSSNSDGGSGRRSTGSNGGAIGSGIEQRGGGDGGLFAPDMMLETADVVAVSSSRGWIEPTSIVPIPHGVGSAGAPQQQWRRPSAGGLSSISGSDGSSLGARSTGSRTGGGTRTKSTRRRMALPVGAVATLLILIVVVSVAVTVVRTPSSGGGANSNSTDSSSSAQTQMVDAPGDYGGGNVSMGSSEPLDMTMNEQDAVYTYPIDLSSTEESPALVQLRGVLIQKLNWNDESYLDTGMRTAALHDRTTPQYRALYWLAEEDGYCQTQLLPLLDIDELASQHYHLEDRILQRYSLAVLYFRTSSDGHGEGWDATGDYLSPKNECEWSTISCRDKCEWEEWLPCDPSIDPLWAVTSLSLESNNLRGPIPLELFHLTGLVELQLRNNNLRGPIPSQIVNLVELDRVDLSRNDLTGTLPEEIGTVAASFGWRYILLSGNQLQGSLPSAWPFATHELHLHGNMLTGTVPLAYTELHQLSLLRIERNLLTGSINFLCDTIAAGVQLFADTSEVECRCCSR